MEKKMVKLFSFTKLILTLAIALQISAVFTDDKVFDKVFNDYLYDLYKKTGCCNSINCTFKLKALLTYHFIHFHQEINKEKKDEHTDFYYKKSIFPKNIDDVNLANKIYDEIYKKRYIPMENFLSKLCENLDKLLELRTDEQKKDASEKWKNRFVHRTQKEVYK